MSPHLRAILGRFGRRGLLVTTTTGRSERLGSHWRRFRSDRVHGGPDRHRILTRDRDRLRSQYLVSHYTTRSKILKKDLAWCYCGLNASRQRSQMSSHDFDVSIGTTSQSCRLMYSASSTLFCNRLTCDCIHFICFCAVWHSTSGIPCWTHQTNRS